MICGSRLFPLHEWVRRFFVIDFQSFLPLAGPWKSFVFSKSVVITSFDIFLGRSLAKLPITLNSQHFPEQDLLSFLLDDQTTNLFCKHIP